MLVPFLVSVLAAFVAYVRWGLGISEEPSIAQIEALRTYVADLFAVKQPIRIRFHDTGFRFPDLVLATQRQLDYQLAKLGIPYRYPLIDELPKHIPRLGFNKTSTQSTRVFTLTDGAISATDAVEDAEEMDISVTPPPDFSLDMALGGNVGVWLDLVRFRAMMTYNLESVHANDLPFYLAQTILDHLCEVDVKLYDMRHNISFDDYVPKLTVNIVAAEDGALKESTVVEDAIEELLLKHLEVIKPFVNVTPRLYTIDVTKNRIPRTIMKNTTDQITFVFLTTLKGFLNQVDGASVYHLLPDKPKTNLGDAYGTEYIEAQKLNESPRINITNFLFSVFGEIEERTGLREKCSNKHLEVFFTTKLLTIKGIEKALKLIKNDPNEANLLTFWEVCKLVDLILSEREHNWSSHLKHIHEIIKKVTGTK